VQITTAVK